jgi:hypothetical protein
MELSTKSIVTKDEHMNKFLNDRKTYLELIKRFTDNGLSKEQAVLAVRKMCVPPNQLHLFKQCDITQLNYRSDGKRIFECKTTYLASEQTHPEFYEIARQEQYTIFQMSIEGAILGSLSLEYRLSQAEIDSEFEQNDTLMDKLRVDAKPSVPDFKIDLDKLQELEQ